MNIREEVKKWLEKHSESMFEASIEPVDNYCDSEHSKIVEAQAVLPYIDTEGNLRGYWQEHVDFRELYVNYSETLIGCINKEAGTSMEFTDLRQSVLRGLCYVSVEVKCSIEDLAKLIDKYESDNMNLFYERVEEAIDTLTTKRDGYIPYYTVSELFKDDGNRLFQLLLDEVCKSIDLLILGNEEFEL